MAATFRSASSGNGGSGTAGSYAVTLPSGWAAGDIVFVVITAGVSALTFDLLSGWYLPHPGDSNTGGGGHSTCVHWRVMQAGDSNPTFTSAGGGKWAWAAIAIQPGAGETLSLDVDQTAKVTTTTSTTLAAPNAATTPSTACSVLLYGCRATGNSATQVNATMPTNWAEAADNGTATGTTAALRQVEAACAYRNSQTGTISPGAGSLNVTGVQNAYHFLLTSVTGTGFTAPLPVRRSQAVKRASSF